MKEEGWFEAAQKGWGWLDGPNPLPQLIQGAGFTDSIEVVVNTSAPQAQAAS